MQNDKILTGIKSALMMLTAFGIGIDDPDSTAQVITAGFLACYGVVNAIRAYYKPGK